MAMITAIVLAAGVSNRMGDINKMLFEIDDTPILIRTLTHLQKSRVDRIVVVIGFEADRLNSMLERKVRDVIIVENPKFKSGMSSSIAAGAQHLAAADGCLICLGDMPFITTDEYDLLIEAFQKSSRYNKIIVPYHRDRPGNPILFGKDYFGDLQRLAQGDKGAKEIVKNNMAHQIRVDMPSEHIFHDIDKPQDLE